MIIDKIKIRNYKIFKEKTIELNESINIFVGENDAGKSTILEIVNLITTGKINGYFIDRQITANFFNYEVRNDYIKHITNGEYAELPEIMIEAYCKKEENSDFRGTNNTLGEDCPGILFYYKFNQDNADIYKKKLEDGEIFDIPIEFYKSEFKGFHGDNINNRYLPFKVASIDASKRDYNNLLNRFVTENVEQFLSDEDKVMVRSVYRKSIMDFNNIPNIQELNKKLKENVKLGNKSISISLKEENVDNWKEDIEMEIDSIPFSSIGFGSRNAIKIELALQNKKDIVSTIIIEEPENNLSYTNMAKLIAKIEENEDKQIFIATHSSYIANKLDLQNIHIVHNGDVNSLQNLNLDTRNYFKKLPGFDTLRVILANKVILVEGPADDLIIQRAYKDKYDKLPINDGIDIIAVNALAFKRYCDIAILVHKEITIVTDNDGDINKNIIEKYDGYIDKSNIKICYEEDESLKTLEPSIIAANTINGKISDNFIDGISKNGSMKGKTREEIKNFMENNKTEWSMRIFDYDKNIQYPQYIFNAIE